MLAEDRYVLLGMLDSIDKIDSYLVGIGIYEDFAHDQKTMDACLMHLINIGEMVARLSENMVSENVEVDWIKIKGLRNIIAHDYFGIDYKEIWSVVTTHIPKLRESLRKYLY